MENSGLIQELFSSLIENSDDGIIIARKNTHFIIANGKICGMLGYSREEILRKTVPDIHPAEALPLILEKFALLAEKQTLEMDSVPLLRKDGSQMIVNLSGYSILIKDTEYIIGIFKLRDDSSLSKRQLKESESLFNSVIKASPMGVHMYRLDNHGALIFDGYNAAADKLLGIDHSQFIGKTIQAAFPPLSETDVPRRYTEAALYGTSWTKEEISYSDKSIRGAFEIYAFQTKPGCMAVMFLDITQRKQAEEKLRHSEEKLLEAHSSRKIKVQERTRALADANTRLVEEMEKGKRKEREIRKFSFAVEQSIDGMAIADPGGAILYANGAFCRMHGFTREQLTGVNIEKLYPPGITGKYATIIDPAMRQQGFWAGEAEELRSDGTSFPVFLSLTVIRDDLDAEIGILRITSDISVQKKSEQKLRFLSSVVTQSSEGMAILTLDGTALFINRAWAIMHGYENDEDLVGQPFTIFHNTDQMEKEVIPFNRTVMEQGFNKGKIGHITVAGKIFPTLMTTTLIKDGSGKPVALAGIAKDITDLANLEEDRLHLIEALKAKNNELEKSSTELKSITAQLVQSGKLAALGELTAGIAHELNQPLNGIKITSQSLIIDIRKERLSQDRLKEKLDIIVGQVNRMADIIQHMRIFTRQSYGSAFQKIDVNELVKDSFTFVEQQLKNNNIIVIRELSPAPLYLSGEKIGLEQVLLNLFSNARHALLKSAKDIRELYVSVKKDGLNVKISVMDNGIGIPKEITTRIFDPFFTTKEPGEGTGLGLSVSKKIIEEHSGTIQVESKPGEYTCFDIIIPEAKQVKETK